jgi:hypothetical protein
VNPGERRFQYAILPVFVGAQGGLVRDVSMPEGVRIILVLMSSEKPARDNNPSSPPIRDHSSEVTVFVLTIGDRQNFTDCMAHLDRQTVRFHLEVVDRVAPLSAALTEMVRRCQTPFYIEVDEDMHLVPDAIERLYEWISATPPEVAIAVCPLWDCDIERAIYGLKIHRHQIVHQFLYEDSHSADTDLRSSLRAAGYQVLNQPLGSRESCLGDHGRHYTPRSIYLRWRRLFEKRRREGGHRGRGVPPPSAFLNRFLRDPQPLHLYSLLGVIAALTRESPGDRSPDYREASADFERLAEAFSGFEDGDCAGESARGPVVE